MVKSTKPLDTQRLQRLVSHLNNLSEHEMEELFLLMLREKCEYSSNNNGVFVNLTWLSVSTIKKIEDFVAFCFQSRNEIERYENMCHQLNEDITDNRKVQKTQTENTAAAVATINTMKKTTRCDSGTPASGTPILPSPAAASAAAPVADPLPISLEVTEIEGDLDEATLASIKKGKVSSSLRFYLLKKKFMKSTGPVSFETDNYLEKDTPLLKRPKKL